MIKIIPLKGRKNFIDAFKNAKKYSNQNAIIYIKYKIKNQLDGEDSKKEKVLLYYGISLSKKIYRKAVIRNRIKRLIREALRRIFYERNNYETALNIEKIIVKWIGEAPKHPKLIRLTHIENALNDILLKIKESHK